ncbi:hypothetical protein PN498_02555 [Oscillatoria sp. CS-180]|uniref:hypothetical protein n=1 Tax=Oscillatoria sp. CS-180 TaxID=3021720 RepID=UPI00232A952A|nr:hypothetical protein [Oscillatoria sp. CS-180]MDB9524856.1 hypothetical protein [Oscillatoria sp. CS-180]
MRLGLIDLTELLNAVQAKESSVRDRDQVDPQSRRYIRVKFNKVYRSELREIRYQIGQIPQKI